MTLQSKLGWTFTGSLLTGLMLASPGLALPPNQSDTGGVGVPANPYVRFGFEPLEKSGLVSPAIESLQATIAALLSNGALSAETRKSLTLLSERIKHIDTHLWDTNKILDASIRESAKGLAQDLAKAKASCNANDAIACNQLNQFVLQTQQFLDQLDQFKAALIRHLNVARIY